MHIKSSCSAAFMHLNASSMKIGAIGENTVLVFGTKPSDKQQSIPYGVSMVVQAKNKVSAIASDSFNVERHATICDVSLNSHDGFCFIVFLNKPMRDCISNATIAHIFSHESHTKKDLAKRVVKGIMEEAKQRYDAVYKNWQETSQEDDTLEKPELGIGLLIINEPPLLNSSGADEKHAAEDANDRSELSAAELQKIYSKSKMQQQDEDRLRVRAYERLIEHARVRRPLEKLQPSSWDSVLEYLNNKYVWSTLLTTCLGYYAYLQFPSIKSFFSGFTKFFK